MTTLDQLFITKACEFCLKEFKRTSFIEQYNRIISARHYCKDMDIAFVSFREEFKDYTAGEMVLLINELANKFREVYSQGAHDMSLSYIKAATENN